MNERDKMEMGLKMAFSGLVFAFVIFGIIKDYTHPASTKTTFELKEAHSVMSSEQFKHLQDLCHKNPGCLAANKIRHDYLYVSEKLGSPRFINSTRFDDQSRGEFSRVELIHQKCLAFYFTLKKM